MYIVFWIHIKKANKSRGFADENILIKTITANRLVLSEQWTNDLHSITFCNLWFPMKISGKYIAQKLPWYVRHCEHFDNSISNKQTLFNIQQQSFNMQNNSSVISYGSAGSFHMYFGQFMLSQWLPSWTYSQNWAFPYFLCKWNMNFSVCSLNCLCGDAN